jgi:hypothetical protein
MRIFKRCERFLRNHTLGSSLFRSLSLMVFAVLILTSLISHIPIDKSLSPSQSKIRIDDHVLLFFSLPGMQSFASLILNPIPFASNTTVSCQEIEAGETIWKASALKTQSVGVLLAELPDHLLQEKQLPLISIIIDESGAGYVLLVGKEGEVNLSSIKYLIENCAIGFQGKSGIEIKIPDEWGDYSSSIRFCLQIAS